MTGLRPRAALLATALALLACSGNPEPDEIALREALGRMHREWSSQLRRDQPPQEVPEFYRRLPNVNLAYEAQFALQIVSARKVLCRPTPEPLRGHTCRVVVAASMAGRTPIIQNVEGRFFRNTEGWQVRDLRVLSPQDLAG